MREQHFCNVDPFRKSSFLDFLRSLLIGSNSHAIQRTVWFLSVPVWRASSTRISVHKTVASHLRCVCRCSSGICDGHIAHVSGSGLEVELVDFNLLWTSCEFNSFIFNGSRSHIFSLRICRLSVGWSYDSFSSCWRGISISFDHIRCCFLFVCQFAVIVKIAFLL